MHYRATGTYGDVQTGPNQFLAHKLTLFKSDYAHRISYSPTKIFDNPEPLSYVAIDTMLLYVAECTIFSRHFTTDSNYISSVCYFFKLFSRILSIKMEFKFNFVLRGSFYPFHQGHLNLFKAAKQYIWKLKTFVNSKYEVTISMGKMYISPTHYSSLLNKNGLEKSMGNIFKCNTGTVYILGQ